MSNIFKLTPYVYLTERTDTSEGEKRYDLFMLVPVDAQTDIDFSSTAAAYPGIPDRIYVDYITKPNTAPPAGVKYRFYYLTIDKKKDGVTYNTIVVRGDGLLTRTLLVDFSDADTNPVASIPANSELHDVPYIHLQKETLQIGGVAQDFVRPSAIVLFDAGFGVVSETVTLLSNNCLHELTIGNTNVVTSDPDAFQINQNLQVQSVIGAYYEASVGGGSGGGNRRKKPKVKNLNAGGGGNMAPNPAPPAARPAKTLPSAPANGQKTLAGNKKTAKKSEKKPAKKKKKI